jgi:hypothetical protein
MRYFKNVLAGATLAATASLGVIAPMESMATPSLRNCQPDNFLVYFDIKYNVLAIDETAESVDCPVSNVISVRFHDHPHYITLTKVSDRWVSNPYPIYKGGCYAVEKVYVNPTHSLTPSWKYDQRIVIKSNPDSGYPNISYCGDSHKTVLQTHPVAPTPPLEEELPRLPASPRQQESRSEPAQAQGQWASVDLEALFKCFFRTTIRFNGWMIDFSPWKACLPR